MGEVGLGLAMALGSVFSLVLTELLGFAALAGQMHGTFRGLRRVRCGMVVLLSCMSVTVVVLVTWVLAEGIEDALGVRVELVLLLVLHVLTVIRK